MDVARGQRVIRGVFAAGIATFVALLSHLSAGAPMPGAVGIVTPLMLSIPICVFLSGKRLSVPRLSVGVVLSQALFHTLFILGTSATALAGGGAHAHHVTSVTITGVPINVHAAHAGPGMWISHTIAAMLTVLALDRGERVLAALFALASLALTVLMRWLGLAPVRVAHRRAVAVASSIPGTPLGVFLVSLRHRGPPLAA